MSGVLVSLVSVARNVGWFWDFVGRRQKENLLWVSKEFQLKDGSWMLCMMRWPIWTSAGGRDWTISVIPVLARNWEDNDNDIGIACCSLVRVSSALRSRYYLAAFIQYDHRVVEYWICPILELDWHFSKIQNIFERRKADLRLWVLTTWLIKNSEYPTAKRKIRRKSIPFFFPETVSIKLVTKASEYLENDHRFDSFDAIEHRSPIIVLGVSMLRQVCTYPFSPLLFLYL